MSEQIVKILAIALLVQVASHLILKYAIRFVYSQSEDLRNFLAANENLKDTVLNKLPAFPVINTLFCLYYFFLVVRQLFKKPKSKLSAGKPKDNFGTIAVVVQNRSDSLIEELTLFDQSHVDIDILYNLLNERGVSFGHSFNGMVKGLQSGLLDFPIEYVKIESNVMFYRERSENLPVVKYKWHDNNEYSLSPVIYPNESQSQFPFAAQYRVISTQYGLQINYRLCKSSLVLLKNIMPGETITITFSTTQV